jgi:hypothetical protein
MELEDLVGSGGAKEKVEKIKLSKAETVIK